MFEICGTKVEKGSKKELKLSVCRTMDDQEMMIPLTVINGAEEGPVLLLDGCIHGDEPEGPLAIIRLINELDPTKLRGTVIAVPAVNVSALAQMKRGNVRDEHNYDLNRIYPGSPEGFLTGRLANIHFNELLKKADMEISIHGGGNHSYMVPAIFSTQTEGSLELARAMGEDWPIVMKSLGNSSPMGQGKAVGVHGITVEIGGTSGAVPWLFDKNIKLLIKAFYNVMYHYKMLAGTPAYCQSWYTGHQETVYADGDGLIDPAAECSLGLFVEQGTVLLRMVNLRGKTVQEAVAPCAGIPFGIRTYPSVATGDWLVFFAAVEKTDKLID